MNKEGYLTIVGRSKDMVIRGGENVYPVELENVFYEHPHVLEAHVHGVPDERMGEEMCAWIRLRKHTSVVEEQDKLQEELKKFCQSRVSRTRALVYYRTVISVLVEAARRQVNCAASESDSFISLYR